MQKKGLVKKVKNSSNERLYVTLTDKGKDIYENTVTERSISLIFDVLSEEERIKLESMLLKLQHKARDLLGLDFKPPLLEQLKSGENNPMVESP
jgi:DNA-binding MarR family transcriptional regulator